MTKRLPIDSDKLQLAAGDRVHVLAHWNWPKACTGRVEAPPEGARLLAGRKNAWQGSRRVVRGRKGPVETYWVVFDKSQVDGDGDGPYWGGEVDANYLRRFELEDDDGAAQQ